MNAVMNPKFNDYKISDITQADWGRREIAIAETEMPGLMAVRAQFSTEHLQCLDQHRRLDGHVQ
jgi:adenosylhomocysteinase